MDQLVPPHGGRGLWPLQLEGEAQAAELQRAPKLRPLRITSREKGDLIMLGIGGFTPLQGFMTRADWQGVCDELSDGGWRFLADPDYVLGRSKNR